MKLDINYKHVYTTITCIELYAKDNILNIVFNNDLKDEFNFFIKYLEANRIEYEIKYDTDINTIIVDLNLFSLSITVKYPVRSSGLNNSFFKAILDHKHKIDYLEDIINEYDKEYKALNAKLKNCDNKKEFELTEKLNEINIKRYEDNMYNILKAIKLTQKELDNTIASVPNVKDLKIAFHMSEMLDEELCEKALYLREYLMNKQKLTKEECNWLEALKKLSKYAYEEDINEVKKMLLVMTSEYFKNAAKYVENEKNVQLKIEENLREFYR